MNPNCKYEESYSKQKLISSFSIYKGGNVDYSSLGKATKINKKKVDRKKIPDEVSN